MEFDNKKPFIWRDKESGEQNYLQPADWNIQEFGEKLIMKCHDSHKALLFKFIDNHTKEFQLLYKPNMFTSYYLII